MFTMHIHNAADEQDDYDGGGRVVVVMALVLIMLAGDVCFISNTAFGVNIK